MAGHTTIQKSLLFIEPFKQKAHYPDKDKQQFFEIYWTAAVSTPALQSELTPAPKGEWLYLVAPYHAREFQLEGAQGRLVRFHRKLLNLELEDFSLEVLRLFQKSAGYASIFVPESEVAVLEDLHRLMVRELKRQPRDFVFLKSLLKSFLLKLVSLHKEHYQLPDINAKRMYHFLVLLENHYKTNRQASFYARELNLSPKRLNQILKEQIGKTITQLLQDRVIMEAQRQLYQGQKSIKEIGIDLGFSDKSYFSRFFKKHTGTSPEGFKKGIQSRM